MVAKIDQSTQKPKKETEKEHRFFFELSRKVVLASIGAMAMAQDELEAFVNKLVERGELAEKDGDGLINELREKRHQRLSKMEEKVNKRVAKTLEHLNIPSKDEIASLNEKIAILNKKLDEVKKS